MGRKTDTFTALLPVAPPLSVEAVRNDPRKASTWAVLVVGWLTSFGQMGLGQYESVRQEAIDAAQHERCNAQLVTHLEAERAVCAVQLGLAQTGYASSLRIVGEFCQ